MVFLAWILFFGVGLAAQSLVQHQHITLGLFLYLIDGSLLATLWMISKKEENPPEPADSPISLPNGYFFLTVPLALILITAAAWLSIQGVRNSPTAIPYSSYALYCWLAFLALLLAGFCISLFRESRLLVRQDGTVLLLLMVSALGIGLYHLTQAPPTVHGDEGMVGLYARKILHGEIGTFFSSSWYAIPQFFFAIPAGTMGLFGDSLFGLRMSTVILGVFALIPFYFLVRGWWGRGTALAAGLLLITNPWFIHLMHCGVNYVQVAFFTILTLAVWVYTETRRSREGLLAAGAVMGVALLSYQANHLLPILWVLSQTWFFVLRRISLKRWLATCVIPLGIAAMVISPLLAHDWARSGQTEMFRARSSEVGAWTEHNRQHLNGVYHADGDTSLIWRNQVERALLSTVFYNDKSIQYGGKAPFLDEFTAVFFLLGIILAAYRFFETRWLIPVAWIAGILLAGGALTVDAPFFPRLAGITALLYLPVAGVFSLAVGMARGKSKTLMQWVGAGFIAFILCGNLHYYFVTYAQTLSPKSVHYAQTRLAYTIQERDPGEYNYVFRGPHFSFESGTVQFLLKDRKGEDLDEPPKNWIHVPFAIYADASRQNVIHDLKESFPTYTMQEYTTVDGSLLFLSLTPQ